MNKNREIISELQSFFTVNDNKRAITSIMNVMSHIRVGVKQMGCDKNANCKLTCEQVYQLMMLFPFFALKNANNYVDSILRKFFSCHKDMFYRFMSNPDIDWRKLVFSVNRRLLQRISLRSDAKKDDTPTCLIVDDTDIPKTGKSAELLGRIHFHVQQRSILGFKGLFLCLTDGKTQTMVDQSLHGELGKNASKPQGLTKEVAAKRYTKDRDGDSKTVARMAEYHEDKISNSIKMIKRAILEGVRFNYLLVDSWFTCKDLVRLVKSRHFDCHLLSMVKMGKTKYETICGVMTAGAIITRLSRQKVVRYNRRHKFYYASIGAKFAGTDVQLFFYRTGRNGAWNALLTTDLTLDACKAYKIYSMRWAIEVAFKECKSLLNLGKCQCRDFASQIASISLCMMQYNILGYVKPFESYETIGGLFREVSKKSIELSVTEKIWGIIIDIVNTISEVLSTDPVELLRGIINNNKEICAVKRAFEAMQIAA